MRATLFPLKSRSIAKASDQAVSPRSDTSKSSTDSSTSENQSEDDVGIMTKDFHRALSSIAKDKSLPALPAFSVPSAKAMSILGRSNVVQNNTTSNNSNERNKNKIVSRIWGGKQDNATPQSQKTIDRSSGYSQKQQLKDVLASLSQHQSKAPSIANRNASKRASKIHSILGTNFTTPFSTKQTPHEVDNSNGSRTTSTLYNQLYSQVLRPSGSHRPDSGVFAFAAEQDCNYGHFDDEPVKRSTYCSTGTPSNCETFTASPVSFDFEHKYNSQNDRVEVSPLKIVKKGKEGKGKPFDGRSSVTGDSIALEANDHPGFVSPAKSKRDDTDAYNAYRALEKMNAANPHENTAISGFASQNTANLSNHLRSESTRKQNASSIYGEPGLSHYSGNQVTGGSPCVNRKPTRQDYTNSASNNGHKSDSQFLVAPNSNTNFPPNGSYYLASSSGSPRSGFTADQGAPCKRPKSPVKKMFSSTVEMIGRMIPAGNVSIS